MMKAASFGQRASIMSATCSSVVRAAASSGCWNAWRSAAATMVCWPFGTCASALRVQCTRQRCQVAPRTRTIAAFNPSWASEITSLMPVRPRPFTLFRKSDQKTSASDGPMCRPTISRRPSVLTATAIIAATETIRPAARTFRSGGIEPQVGPFAGEGAGQEAVHPLVDVLTQLADGGLGNPGHPHCVDQLVDPAGRDAADPGFLDHRYQRLLHRPARLQKAGKIRSLAQLRDAQVERVEPRLQRSVAITIAIGQSTVRAFMPAGADQRIDIGVHDDLQHGLRQSA